MSLVNKMLRDLDERQASPAERAGLAGQVRALPPRRRLPWPSIMLAAVAAAAGAAGVWLIVGRSESPPVSVPPAAAVPAPTPVAMPALVVPMPVRERPAVPRAPAVAEPAAPRTDPGPREPAKNVAMPRPAAEAATEPRPPATQPGPAAIDKRPSAPAAETAEGTYQKAMAAHRQGRSQEAAEGFRTSLRLDGRHIPARQALLSLLIEQRQWGEAQAVATEGLALVSAQPGWAMVLARLHVEQGQIAEAERIMAAHATHAVRSADYQAFHGLLLEKLQRGEEARAAFARAREAGNLSPELAAAIEQRLK